MGKAASTILAVVGALWTLGMAYVLATAGAAYLRTGPAPVVTKVAGAPAERWIRLEDAHLRCDTRVFRNGFTYFAGEGPQGADPFVAQLSGDRPCEGAALDGGFLPGSFTRAWVKQRFGLDVPGQGDVRLFTEALAPRFLKGVLFRTVAWFLLGVAVLAVSLRSLRRAQRGGGSRPLVRG